MPESLDVRAKRIIDAAVELSGAEREACIQRACGADTQLRNRVDALLAAMQTEDTFLSEPEVSVPPLDTAATVEQVGGRIGPYKLLELIGEGGFGSVFMAEQFVPLNRRVALKIIKLGMDTRAVVARFEQERQALALMDHAHIAKVLDAGATQAGRPYFVMELVKGQPITEYCDTENLSIADRLQLFTQVCRAVQHAHTKGVIHRDIKPGNILVRTQDGRPHCKIIDFGVAKAIQRPLVDKTIFTEFRQLIGTPVYMSPEQATGSLDIDTRTDVYSLGVLLYELLTGQTPFEAHRLRSAAFEEMQRIIRDVDPPKPSTRVSAMTAASVLPKPASSSAKSSGSGQTAATVAAVRRSDPRLLVRTLRGELDWIVMRALDKDRARRYESPGDLAADVERCLAGEPVQAAPPSTSYRLRKLARRHRVGVAVTAIVTAALVLGFGVAVWEARVAARDRDSARRSAAEAEKARADAEARRQEMERVAQFQAAELRGVDPEQMGKQICAALLIDAKSAMQRAGLQATEIATRQAELNKMLADVNPTNVALKTLDENIFARALAAVDKQFKDQPLIRARLLHTLGETMSNLGLLESADSPLAQALAIRRESLGDLHRDTIDTLVAVGILAQQQGKLPDAEAKLREAARLAMLVPDCPPESRLEATINLASVLQMLGKLAEAESCCRDSIEQSQKLLGPDHIDSISAINNLGFVQFGQGKLKDAEASFRRSLDAFRRTVGDEHAGTRAAANNLASILQREGKLAEAEKLFRDALSIARRTDGEEHPTTLQLANNVGFVLYLAGKYDESEVFARDTLDRRRRVLGNDHYDTLQSIHNMGLLRQATGKPDEAEKFFREAVDRRRQVLGEKSAATLQSLCSLGVFFREQGRLADAEPLLRAALDGRRAALGDEHPDTLESLMAMGRLQAAQGKLQDSEATFRQAMRLYAKKDGEKHFQTARARCELGAVLRDEGRFADAESLLLEASDELNADEAVSDKAARKQCAEAIVTLYELWDKSAAGHKHAARAEEWRKRQGG